MGIFGKSKEQLPKEPTLAERLQALEERKAELESLIGTDAWVAADGELLDTLNKEIEGLKREQERKEGAPESF